MRRGLSKRCARCAIVDAVIAQWLSPPERLAIAYAPRHLRAAWTGLIALDRRLGDAARDGREPIMIQLRLAWWRDRLAEPSAHWPRGEPLLALLGAWDQERAALIGLVDGWEAQSVGEDDGGALAGARQAAIAALARLAGLTLTPVVLAAAADWGANRPLRCGRLPRALRPLVLLNHFAQSGDAPAWRIMLGALRKAIAGI